MDEKQESSELPADKKKDAGRFNKKKCGMIAAVIVVIITLLVGINLGNSSAGRLREQLELGQKYLEEMKYEEAVVAFNNAIEIDPMNADAYLGLAEVYIRTGDFDTAYEYAAKGYEMTGDERLKEKMDMIESGNITASNGWRMRESYYNDGALIGYATYSYDLQGRHKSIAVYDRKGHLVDKGDWEYDEQGLALTEYSLGWQGDLQGGYCYAVKRKNELDKEGRYIDSKTYHKNGNLKDWWKYEEGRMTAWKTYQVSGDLLYSYEEYEYDTEGREISYKVYDGSGNLVSCYENEWDAEGREIGSKVYDGSGNLESYIEKEYAEEGRKIIEKVYDGSGDLNHYTERKYDTEGNQIAAKSYYNDGSSWEFRYE